MADQVVALQLEDRPILDINTLNFNIGKKNDKPIRRCFSLDFDQKRRSQSAGDLDITKSRVRLGRTRSVILNTNTKSDNTEEQSKPQEVNVDEDKESDKIERMRNSVIDELIATELSYVVSLSTVNQYFISGLSEPNKKPILGNDKLKKIFLNWQSIMNCHQKILKQMNALAFKARSNMVQHIGSIFVDSKMNSFYQLYSYFVNNFDRSRHELVTAKSSIPAFAKFIQETEEKIAAESSNRTSLLLESYLIMPVQRIPRYLMLIGAIIKFTSPQESGYDDLVRAHEQFQAITTLINESKRKAEKLEEVKKLCMRIHGFPMEILLSTSGLNLIKSGELVQKVHKGQKDEEMTFLLVLLNDRLIIAGVLDKKDKDADHSKYKYKLYDMIALKDMRFYLDQNKTPHSLKIDRPVGSLICTDKHYRFYLNDSDQELHVWYSVLLETYNQACSGNELIVKDDNNHEKKRQLLEKYLEKEVPYIHHLQGLLPVISLEIPVETEKPDVTSPREERPELETKSKKKNHDSNKKNDNEKEKEKDKTKKIILKGVSALAASVTESIQNPKEDSKKDKNDKEKDKDKEEKENDRDGINDSIQRQRSKVLLRKSLKRDRTNSNNRLSRAFPAHDPEPEKNEKPEKTEKPEKVRPRGSSNPAGDSPAKVINRAMSLLPENDSGPSPTVKALQEKLLNNNSPFRLSKHFDAKKLLSSNSNPEDHTSETEEESTKKVVKHKREGSGKKNHSSDNKDMLPIPSLFSPRKEEVVVNTGMTTYLKPIFESIRPIIDKHVEMKPILFEKVSQFDSNPNLISLIPHFNGLFETYETFCSVYEGRKFLLKSALVPVVGKKKQTELINLSQRFEEVHMISLDSFLGEVSTRVVHIYTLLTEYKKITQMYETGFKELEELCSNVEWMQEKIINRLKKTELNSLIRTNEKTNNTKESQSKKKIASEKNKFIYSPRITDKKVVV